MIEGMLSLDIFDNSYFAWLPLQQRRRRVGSPYDLFRPWIFFSK